LHALLTILQGDGSSTPEVHHTTEQLLHWAHTVLQPTHPGLMSRFSALVQVL
jgi:hypothetical protein